MIILNFDYSPGPYLDDQFPIGCISLDILQTSAFLLTFNWNAPTFSLFQSILPPKQNAYLSTLNNNKNMWGKISGVSTLPSVRYHHLVLELLQLFLKRFLYFQSCPTFSLFSNHHDLLKTSVKIGLFLFIQWISVLLWNLKYSGYRPCVFRPGNISNF